MGDCFAPAIVAAIPGRYGEDVPRASVKPHSLPTIQRRLPSHLGVGVRSLALAGVTATLLSGFACRPDPSPSEPARHDPHAMGKHAPAAAEPKRDRGAASVEQRLRDVEEIHGGAGPWAVAGYRMGEHALGRLGVERRSFDLEVVHRSPRSVQYSCIADGAAAATGASLGKLNLSLEETDVAHVETVYRRKSTGAVVTLRPAAAFAARFADVPLVDLAARGREAMELPAEQIFEEVR